MLTSRNSGTALSDSVRDMFIPGANIDPLNNTSLGRGTFGFVEKGKYKSSSDEWINVAIKYVHSRDDVPSLIKEARTMYSLKGHPHCVEIYGLFDCPRTGVGVVMEFMDCKSLAGLIPRLNISYKIDHMVSWMYQLARAVDYFHSNNELHRDLKLQNLLLSDRYRVLKVGDFGTFTMQRDTMHSLRGTPVTMAPEIFKEEKYNSKCDIYSVGIIMWQIIARRDPYKIAVVPALLWNVANGKRPPELTCNPYLSGFYKRCWHEDPKCRPDSKDVLEYFKILREMYPKGNEPLMDHVTQEPARTPQPTKVLTASASASGHRRTGSDQSTLNSKITDSGISDSVSGMRDNRSKSVANPPKRPSHSATVTPTKNVAPTNIMAYIDVELRPLEPLHNEESQQTYSEHVALCHKLYDLNAELLRQLKSKHSMQMMLKQLLEEKALADEKKMLETIRDEALKKIQQHS